MGVSHVELRHCQSVLWAPDTPESGPAEKTWVMGVIMQNTNCGLRPNRCLLLQLRHALVPDWTLLVPSCSSHGINPVHLVL